jgi:hypothetical protein
VLTGSCHCGAARWTLEGEVKSASACNCTLCRRYGVLWAYGAEGETIRLAGPTHAYVRADKPDPLLEIRFCPACAAVLAWRGLRLDAKGRRRMAVNLRLAPPEAVAAVPLKRVDGLGAFAEVPSEGRCVGDVWF